jgi:hypothetical protein
MDNQEIFDTVINYKPFEGLPNTISEVLTNYLVGQFDSETSEPIGWDVKRIIPGKVYILDYRVRCGNLNFTEGIDTNTLKYLKRAENNIISFKFRYNRKMNKIEAINFYAQDAIKLFKQTLNGLAETA